MNQSEREILVELFGEGEKVEKIIQRMAEREEKLSNIENNMYNLSESEINDNIDFLESRIKIALERLDDLLESGEDLKGLSLNNFNRQCGLLTRLKRL